MAKPKFLVDDTGVVILYIKDGPEFLDTEHEYEIGDWEDAQLFVNRLQRCIFNREID